MDLHTVKGPSMSEEGRASRNLVEPTKQGPAGAQRWAAYLDWVREEVIAGVAGLSADVQRRSLVPSGWSPLELLSHVLHMEQRWFVWGFLGEEVDEPWGDWSTDEPGLADDADETKPGARWGVPADVNDEDLIERLRAVGGRTRRVLEEYPLAAPAASGGRFGANPPTLEWICFHVLAEYARHAGHLDIVVELGT